MQPAVGPGAPAPNGTGQGAGQGARRAAERHEEKVLMRLSCKGNKVEFAIEDIVLSCRMLAVSCNLPESEVYQATAQKSTGPYTVAVSKAVAHEMKVDTVTIFGTKTEKEAEFEVIELDADGFTEASRERFAAANAERAARRATRSAQNDNTLRIFVDLPDTYMVKKLGEFNDLVDKTMDYFRERLNSIAGMGGVQINVISVESSTLTGLPYNTFLVFANFADKNIAELALSDLTELKYYDDGSSSQMTRARIPLKSLEALGVSGCCFRTTGACEAERAQNGNRCLVRDRAYEARREARRRAGPSEAFREARAREKEAAKALRKRAREEAQAEAEAKSKTHCKQACPKWQVGKCLRHNDNCSRRHTREEANRHDADIRATDTACIDCASLVGGSNYDPEWVCKVGEARCPYNHIASSV